MTTTARRTGMTEEAADASVDQACRMLRLPTIRAQFGDAAADAAAREQMSYLGFLAELPLARPASEVGPRVRTHRVATIAGVAGCRGLGSAAPGHLDRAPRG